MNIQEQILKDDIMKRVRFVYGMKALPRVFLPKLAVLSSLVAVAGFFVSMPNVLKNMPSLLEIPSFFGFFTAAFLNTSTTIQLLSLGTIAVLFYMVRDIVNTVQGRTPSLLTA
ncbi:MAG: hypothetical protein AAB511_02625 [Patescibacteria group bacterium]